jgi:hypothetical protein
MSLAPLAGYVCARRPSAGPNQPPPAAGSEPAAAPLRSRARAFSQNKPLCSIHANPPAARHWPLTCAGNRARVCSYAGGRLPGAGATDEQVYLSWRQHTLRVVRKDPDVGLYAWNVQVRSAGWRRHGGEGERRGGSTTTWGNGWHSGSAMPLKASRPSLHNADMSSPFLFSGLCARWPARTCATLRRNHVQELVDVDTGEVKWHVDADTRALPLLPLARPARAQPALQ